MSPPNKYRAPSLGDVLRNVIKRRSRFQAHINHQEIFLRWNEIAGAHLAQKVVPLEVKGSVLIVGASNSSWAQEVTFFKQRILSRIKQEVSAKPIRDVRVVVVDSHTFSNAERHIDAGDATEEESEIPSFLSPSTQSTEDEDLESRLLRLQEADQQMKDWRRRQGWPKCSTCEERVSPELVTPEGLCPICQRQSRRDQVRHVQQLLEEMPWISAEELMRESGLSLRRCSTLRHERFRYWDARVSEGVDLEKPPADFRRRVMQLMMARLQTAEPPLTPDSVSKLFDDEVSRKFFDRETKQGGKA